MLRDTNFRYKNVYFFLFLKSTLVSRHLGTSFSSMIFSIGQNDRLPLFKFNHVSYRDLKALQPLYTITE